MKEAKTCGNSSVDRALPCQGRGRGFEPRFPLHIFGDIAKWYGRIAGQRYGRDGVGVKIVRHEPGVLDGNAEAKPLYLVNIGDIFQDRIHHKVSAALCHHAAEGASVTIDGRIHGQIGQGFLVLLGITDGDTVDDAVYLADKTVKMRVFTDENDKMNRSLADVGGGLLIVSQFTLYGDCRKGNRPSFTNAARPETAIPLYEAFIARCRESGLPVETGEFGADMKVELLNDGPVTLWMDTKDMRH